MKFEFFYASHVHDDVAQTSNIKFFPPVVLQPHHEYCTLPTSFDSSKIKKN